MLKIDGKTFMNIQEAVQWLLENNALPFQSTANYAGNTEIGLGTIVNPSPAKVRIGSLIFFADSKVSTVVGITETGFICSTEFNNLVDDVAYVTNVTINASGHLITTLSNGQTIDAGIIKQVSGFSINGSQHLIVSFNDGTSTDLGAIFSGNVTISGNLTIDGNLLGENIKKYFDSSISSSWLSGATLVTSFVKAFLNCGELQFIANFRLKNETGSDITIPNDSQMTNYFDIPSSLKEKIYAHTGNTCETGIQQGSIAYCELFVSKVSGAYDNSNMPRYVNLYHAGGAQIYMYNEGGTITIPAGESRDFEARISLAL